MACKNRTGEIFIIYENVQQTHYCWLMVGSLYEPAIGAYIHDIRILYDMDKEIPSNTLGYTEASTASLLVRRKSTRIVRFDDM